MNVLKQGLLTALALTFSLSVYAETPSNQSITAAEKGTLATIATIDKNEILVSSLAKDKKANANVLALANMMIQQHGENLKQILTMDRQYNLGALNSSEAEKLSKDGKEALKKLSALDGNAFAIAYANAMVKGHEAVLTLIDDKLMKTATSDEIKQFLIATRATVQQHLEHAKMLQAELKS